MQCATSLLNIYLSLTVNPIMKLTLRTPHVPSHLSQHQPFIRQTKGYHHRHHLPLQTQSYPYFTYRKQPPNSGLPRMRSTHHRPRIIHLTLSPFCVVPLQSRMQKEPPLERACATRACVTLQQRAGMVPMDVGEHSSIKEIHPY